MSKDDFLDDDGKWKCMRCGACCHLALWHESLLRKVGMLNFMGENGWCKHYDIKEKGCRIYENRPMICRGVDAPLDRERAAICDELYSAAKEGSIV